MCMKEIKQKKNGNWVTIVASDPVDLNTVHGAEITDNGRRVAACMVRYYILEARCCEGHQPPPLLRYIEERVVRCDPCQLEDHLGRVQTKQGPPPTYLRCLTGCSFVTMSQGQPELTGTTFVDTITRWHRSVESHATAILWTYSPVCEPISTNHGDHQRLHSSKRVHTDYVQCAPTQPITSTPRRSQSCRPSLSSRPFRSGIVDTLGGERRGICLEGRWRCPF